MTTADDLLAFVRAQFDQDEQVARAATPGPWRHNPRKHWRKPGTAWFEEAVFAGPAGTNAVCIAGTGETDHPQSMADAEHIARHDPAHVLTDVAAKRRQLDIIEAMLGEDPATTGMYAHQLLLAHAAAYRDHPAYLPEWQPTNQQEPHP